MVIAIVAASALGLFFVALTFLVLHLAHKPDDEVPVPVRGWDNDEDAVRPQVPLHALLTDIGQGHASDTGDRRPVPP